MGRRASCASPWRRPSLRPWRGWLGSHSSAGTWDKLGGGGYEINSLFRPSQTSCMGTSSGSANDEKAGGEAEDRVTAGKWSWTWNCLCMSRVCRELEWMFPYRECMCTCAGMWVGRGVLWGLRGQSISIPQEGLLRGKKGRNLYTN